MPITKNEYNAKSKGGTELSIAEMERHLDADLLAQVEIVPGRFRGFATEGLPRIFWVHDTADDPEMNHLADGGWDKFDKIVFVSNWQRQAFQNKFGIPWSKCAVVYNAVDAKPFRCDIKKGDPIRFVYHTTPHRGLNVLVAAFEELLKHRDDVELHVYSSFSIYGWTESDKPFEKIFDSIRKNPKSHYYGAVSNETIREVLPDTHAFVYPSIWPETGCRALIEAMCDGVLCTVDNFGALYETAMGIANVFDYNEDYGKLAHRAYQSMLTTCAFRDMASEEQFVGARRTVAGMASSRFGWHTRKLQWRETIEGILK